MSEATVAPEATAPLHAWICRTCKCVNTRERMQCSECGKRWAGDTKAPSDSRQGDWYCCDIENVNHARRKCCRKCGTSRRQPVLKRKPGDWDCDSCGETNFASRSTCYRCSKPASDGVARPDGDWTCTVCKFLNFRRNKECKVCGTVQSFKAVVEAKLKEADEIKKRAKEEETRVQADGAAARVELEKELDAVRRLGTADDRMCTICVENPKNAMCLPCRHVFACMACSEKIETCSICRAHIASIDRVFIC